MLIELMFTTTKEKSVTSYKNKYLRQYNQYIGNASSITATRQIYLRKNDQYVYSNSTNMNTENTTNIYTCMRLAAIVQIYIIYGKYHKHMYDNPTNKYTANTCTAIPQIYTKNTTNIYTVPRQISTAHLTPIRQI